MGKEWPNNFDRHEGYTLVNVMPWKQFVQSHIPGSISIEPNSLSRFGFLFHLNKEIIVYGASATSHEPRLVVQELRRRGFTNVSLFQGGLSDWRTHGGDVHLHHFDGDY